MHSGLFRLAAIISLTLFSSLSLCGQTSGQLRGTVRSATGSPVAGITVVATNQVTRSTRETRSQSDGSYSLQLTAGAYRLSLAQPAVAQFDTTKTYGDFTIIKGGDTLENVIVQPGKDTTIDIPLAPEPRRLKAAATTYELRIVGESAFLNMIAMATAVLVEGISLSKKVAGGILTTKAF